MGTSATILASWASQAMLRAAIGSARVRGTLAGRCAGYRRAGAPWAGPSRTMVMAGWGPIVRAGRGPRDPGLEGGPGMSEREPAPGHRGTRSRAETGCHVGLLRSPRSSLVSPSPEDGEVRDRQRDERGGEQQLDDQRNDQDSHDQWPATNG